MRLLEYGRWTQIVYPNGTYQMVPGHLDPTSITTTYVRLNYITHNTLHQTINQDGLTIDRVRHKTKFL